MASPRVILLGTLETKGDEVGYLAECLTNLGLAPETHDVSLKSGGAGWSVDEKLTHMDRVADQTTEALVPRLAGAVAVVGIGGGTGGEIILRIMGRLPMRFSKLLVTTLPFDPRAAVADNAITIIPTLADIAGLNASLRSILETTAAMVSGLASTSQAADMTAAAIGITALGVTNSAACNLFGGLKERGHETMVFHANGYGGAAFARFAREGAFAGIIDLTVHEITRQELAGAHVPMPDRFTCAPDLPRIVLPGGLNFIGLGELSLIPQRYLDRPHYQHSGYFTHVQVTADEAAAVTNRLCDHLASVDGPVEVILPMGGFSSEDRPGGAIESVAIRDRVAETFERHDAGLSVTCIPNHINEPETAEAAIAALDRYLPHR